MRLSQLDEERRRICTALGLKASIYSDGRVEIAGQPAGGFLSGGEWVKWRQECRARVERLLSKDGTQR